ncbi:hypothetical protein ON010_g18380 [Phytophthora cinnamomi]|nr:hypothetical protein ON010_g18380 [Phytophthora cinnamomi]
MDIEKDLPRTFPLPLRGAAARAAGLLTAQPGGRVLPEHELPRGRAAAADGGGGGLLGAGVHRGGTHAAVPHAHDGGQPRGPARLLRPGDAEAARAGQPPANAGRGLRAVHAQVVPVPLPQHAAVRAGNADLGRVLL